MKMISTASILFFFSLVSLAQKKVQHECVPLSPHSDISKLLIVNSMPDGKEFLELYDLGGHPKNRWEVEYSDDMTYIAYSNERENIYFHREWPVPKDRGPGMLEMGSWSAPPREQKTYRLECSVPSSGTSRDTDGR